MGALRRFRIKAPLVIMSVFAVGLLGVAPTSFAGHETCEIAWDIPNTDAWTTTVEEWRFRWHHPTYFSSGTNKCLPTAGRDSYHEVQRSWATGNLQLCSPIGNVNDEVCTHTDPAAPDGAHTLTVRICAPTCGAWSTSPLNGLDRMPPAAELLATDLEEVADGVRIAHGGFYVTVATSDATSGIRQVELRANRITTDGIVVLTGHLLDDASGPGTHTLSYDHGQLSPWVNQVSLVVDDAAGHVTVIDLGVVIIPSP